MYVYTTFVAGAGLLIIEFRSLSYIARYNPPGSVRRFLLMVLGAASAIAFVCVEYPLPFSGSNTITGGGFPMLELVIEHNPSFAKDFLGWTTAPAIVGNLVAGALFPAWLLSLWVRRYKNVI